MKRRALLAGTAAALITSVPSSFLARAVQAQPAHRQRNATLPPQCPHDCSLVAALQAHVDLITRVNTCRRPFRHAGPRVEAEKLGEKLIIHNYGHGGSGWSLCWGSSRQALGLAQAASSGNVDSMAVAGCGPLGLSAALLAQRAGISVCIYAKALPPTIASLGATGLWSPDSRFCASDYGDGWTLAWNDMANFLFQEHSQAIAQPGMSVEWFNGYRLSYNSLRDDDRSFEALPYAMDEPRYAKFASNFLPPSVELPPGSHPFPLPHARCFTGMMFNLPLYAQALMDEFLARGGRIEIREFRSLGELAALPENVVINATGYGARALVGDESVIPVRGQTVRLSVQPAVRYALRSGRFLVMPRRDGILVQNVAETGGFNNADDTPDRAGAEDIVRELQAVTDGMRCASTHPAGW